MDRQVPLIRWRVALVVLALGFAALLRSLPAPASISPGGLIVSDAHALCASSTDSDGSIPPSGHADGCDSCCLPAGRVAVLPQGAVEFAVVPQPVRHVAQKVSPLRPETRGPPFEAWAQERAQRGPPAGLIA
jgi:hypothetical protein